MYGYTYDILQTTPHLQGDKEEHYFSPVMLSQGPERKKRSQTAASALVLQFRIGDQFCESVGVERNLSGDLEIFESPHQPV